MLNIILCILIFLLLVSVMNTVCLAKLISVKPEDLLASDVRNHFIDDLLTYSISKGLEVEIMKVPDGKLKVVHRTTNNEVKEIFDLILPDEKVKIDSKEYKALIELTKEQISDYIKKIKIEH